jgi:ABC-type glutathione transport system ATPase component
MPTITLTTDQQNALDTFISFLLDPIERVFVLSGYSGTGKSTLVKHILDYLPKYQKTLRLINPKATDYDVQLTATTNKAAEALQSITQYPVSTIHSVLGHLSRYSPLSRHFPYLLLPSLNL